MRNIFIILVNLLVALFILSGCTKSKEVGSKENPLKFYLIPAQDLMGLDTTGKALQKYLEKELNISVAVELPPNYIAVVEAFGSKRADVAILNTFGYILAKEKYDVVPRLKLVNRGRDEYFGQIIAHVDGPKTIKEINGKSFAFVDPLSTSGYLFPLRYLTEQKVKVKEKIFAGSHDAVVTAVYQKKVAAGATFYTPPDADGTPKDARWIVRAQFPDIYDKVKILQIVGPIPNDPLVFRKDLPEELKVKVAEALTKYLTTPEGKKIMFDMYHITDFKQANDADYDVVRKYLKELGQQAEDFIKK
ncbi:MAG: phosphate/phosphite/phosphonate ABC transporter substrate-binding protein [Bdellovibrionaceae bacterium]|nr:phosphate/phosphite/phosphonate ABC transporter substrate-binding protein [Pseudobdellovibrionaceae bacterium]